MKKAKPGFVPFAKPGKGAKPVMPMPKKKGGKK